MTDDRGDVAAARRHLASGEWEAAAVAYRTLVLDELKVAHRDEARQLRLRMGWFVEAVGLAAFMGADLLPLVDPMLLMSEGVAPETAGVLLQGASDAMVRHVDNPLREVRSNWQLVSHVEEQGQRFAETILAEWRPQP